ncbi:DUF4157 domain-containing protein [Streptomyces sp. SID4913]|uniref:eCIS core domain-containing protein n=1 Tax=Streptomyces sp. ATexAB-D23 TaxID=1157635 RepID=UPI00039CF454|nr:DUF4157 domain-containing protein [Streptomyces sp. SID4913]MYY06764.1 DUF4157 domain-containing protein [Streptomyces sp. SID4913]
MPDHKNVRETGAGAAARRAVSVPPPAIQQEGLLSLQATVGNEVVVQMLRRADRLREPEEHRHVPGCGHEGTGREPRPVQRSTVHDVLRRPGRPMDEATRTDMEARLGADFSDVRVHNDAAAKASAAEVGARAYMSGSHVVLGRGGADRHTLAHELIHVIQQRHGPVAGTDNGSGLKVSDPSDRFEREAEANAKRAMGSARAPLQRASASARQSKRSGTSGKESIQRVKTCPCTDPYCTAGERCSRATPSYMLGQHGIKEKEQARLSARYNTTVNGTTHQSEHLFAYRVLQGDSSLTRGKSNEAKSLDNNALAYQELHGAHRAHPGTGTSKKVGPSGFNAVTYRDDTHSLLSAHQAGAAGQLNTIGYVHNQNGQWLDLNDPDVQAMNDSQLQMIYAQGQRGVDMATRAGGQNVVQNVQVSWEELLEQRTAHLMRSMSRQDAETQARTELGPYYY